MQSHTMEMKVLVGMAALIAEVGNLQPENDWVYVAPEDWRTSPVAATYYFLPEKWIATLPADEIFEDDEGLELPVAVRGRNLKGWRTVQDVKYLIDHLPPTDDKAAALVDLVRGQLADRPSWTRSQF